jgi:WD40 repeat protein
MNNSLVVPLTHRTFVFGIYLEFALAKMTKNTLRGHAKSVTTLLNINSSPFLIASGSRDWTIKIWHVDTGKEVKTLLGHGSLVQCLVLLSNRTKHLASGSYDRTIRIWNFENDAACLLATIFAHSSAVLSLLLLPTSENLISAGADTLINLWHIKSDPTSGYVSKNLNGDLVDEIKYESKRRSRN